MLGGKEEGGGRGRVQGGEGECVRFGGKGEEWVWVRSGCGEGGGEWGRRGVQGGAGGCVCFGGEGEEWVWGRRGRVGEEGVCV